MVNVNSITDNIIDYIKACFRKIGGNCASLLTTMMLITESLNINTKFLIQFIMFFKKTTLHDRAPYISGLNKLYRIC
tara:strand:+ start:890 stop:1120 length:231 start_codon:yes stop_codon:yes gene_type:complete